MIRWVEEVEWVGEIPQTIEVDNKLTALEKIALAGTVINAIALAFNVWMITMRKQ